MDGNIGMVLFGVGYATNVSCSAPPVPVTLLECCGCEYYTSVACEACIWDWGCWFNPLTPKCPVGTYLESCNVSSESGPCCDETAGPQCRYR